MGLLLTNVCEFVCNRKDQRDVIDHVIPDHHDEVLSLLGGFVVHRRQLCIARFAPRLAERHAASRRGFEWHAKMDTYTHRRCPAEQRRDQR